MKNNGKPSLDFSEDIVREMPVLYKDKTYLLREPTTEAGKKMQNLLGQSSVVNSSGNVVKLNNPGDLPAKFVSHCLFFVGEDGKEKHVPETDLNTWPARYIKMMMVQITEWIKEQNEKVTEETLQKEINSLQDKLNAMKESGAVSLEEATVKN